MLARSAAAAEDPLVHLFGRLLGHERGGRDTHNEARAAARRRSDFELGAQRLDIAMHHGETQAKSAILARAGPRYLRALVRDSCVNGSAACLINAGLIPIPVSLTSSTRPGSALWAGAALMRTVTLPWSVNLIALRMRLERIERSGRRAI